MMKNLLSPPLKFSTLQNILIIILRISMGIFFMTTGFNKLFVEKNQMVMLETIKEAGIPFPEFMSVFVSAAEFGFGALLIIGLLTYLSSVGLLIICIVAFLTTGFWTIPSGLDMVTWLSWFFYVNDLLYIFIFLVLLTHKLDSLTVDHWLVKYL